MELWLRIIAWFNPPRNYSPFIPDIYSLDNRGAPGTPAATAKNIAIIPLGQDQESSDSGVDGTEGGGNMSQDSLRFGVMTRVNRGNRIGSST